MPRPTTSTITVPRLLTAARIAEELGMPRARVDHVLRAYRGLITPAAFAGRVRLYRSAAIDEVATVLRDIDSLRARRVAGQRRDGLAAGARR